jgi:hypothetical protein
MHKRQRLTTKIKKSSRSAEYLHRIKSGFETFVISAKISGKIKPWTALIGQQQNLHLPRRMPDAVSAPFGRDRDEIETILMRMMKPPKSRNASRRNIAIGIVLHL